MIITSCTLKNFRCFDEYTTHFTQPIVIIEGHNGCGKSSLLEALHYACYLKSFRTHTLKELISFKQESFYIDILGHDQADAGETTRIRIGYSPAKRVVKVNEKKPDSYKDLVSSYKIISIHEPDLQLITGSPEFRRSALDQALLIRTPSAALYLKRYKTYVEQRNALLDQPSFNQTVWEILTKQVWECGYQITQLRQELLGALQIQMQALIQEHFMPFPTITLSYESKGSLGESFEEFLSASGKLFEQERFARRTLFGPHLDDLSIEYNNLDSRHFASRGQQKLIMVLFKIAQCTLNQNQSIILLDDILADFDQNTLSKIVMLCANTSPQLFITTPTPPEFLVTLFKSNGKEIQHIKL